MTPPPIHYVLKRFPKLTESFVVDEVLALEAAGHTVLIDSLEPPLDEPRHPGLSILRAHVRYVPEQPERRQSWRAQAACAFRRPVTWARAARSARRTQTVAEFRRSALIARRCSRARACVIQTHFAYYAADVAAVAARLAGRRFAITAHANDIWQVANAPHLERRLSRADAVVTATEYNARHLRAVAGETPVHVVPYAVESADPAPAPADGPILCVARLVPKKGVDTLIRAFALLAGERVGLRLELIGEGHVEDELRALAAELGVEERVAFRGPQPQGVVYDAYARCSLVALACRVADDGDRDGLPVVLHEALARGLPVVTTSVVGIPELVRDRTNGLIVPPDDPDALAGAIRTLLDDRELARRLGAEGRRFVRQTRSHAARVEALRRVLA
jgi:glycosyltransferase involved in cell wall biosynthesis